MHRPNLLFRPISILLGSLLALSAVQAAPPLQNVAARTGLSLNGKWHVIVDPYENGFYNYRREAFDASPAPTGGYFLDRKPADKSTLVEYDFDTSPTLTVPGDWNSQEEKLFYYEGTVWYRHRFDYTPADPTHRLFLHFGAANYLADVYLNGHKLGRHVGGFTPFAFEVTGLVLPTGNSLVVRVDNTRHADAVPTVNTDWWNYGGLTRDVTLLETPATFIADYNVQLKKGAADRIVAHVRLDGARLQQKVTLAIPELGLTAELATDATGEVITEFAAPALTPWSPGQPKLYAVTLATETDRIADRIGFRSIAVRGADILLNGESVFLRGICLHEENPFRGGRANSEAEARQALGWAKELGCNFVRLAHYPHNEHLARVADELGLLLWEEIPVYWTIAWENPATLANARAQLTDLIVRDRNRASVIVWSVANETPVSEARTHFLQTLVDTARSLDNTRLVSAAMEVRTDPLDANHKIVDDPFGASTDLLSFNQYVGWYDGLPDKLPLVRWTLGYEKPVVISEFGADALQGLHGDRLTRFSEEYQADLYVQTLAMLQKIPQWRGATPWILTDFRSPRRPLPHIQDGWNRKGLIGENGTKKQAFYVLQKFYQERAAASAPDAARIFRAFHGDDFPTGKWIAEAGILHSVKGQRVDLVTREEYEDFELELDWKVTAGANSGIMYGVSEVGAETFWSGPEMQINDDPNHPDGLQPKTSAGALYDLIAPNERKLLKPTGEYNHVRIVSTGGHVEHWLNGAKILEYEWDSPALRALIGQTKFATAPLFMKNRKGHIALQSEGDEVWFRDIRIRRLPAAPASVPAKSLP